MAVSEKELLLFLFVVDTSGSMYEQPIAAVNAALRECVSEMQDIQRTDVYDVNIGILTFHEKMDVLMPLTDIADCMVPMISVLPGRDGFYPQTRYSCLYRELPQLLDEKLLGQIQRKGMLYIYLLTDGCPVDEAAGVSDNSEIFQTDRMKKAHRYVVLTGESNTRLTEGYRNTLSFVNQAGNRIMRISDLPRAISQIRVEAERRNNAAMFDVFQ